ncbi:MAG TPA: glycosyl hydrolase [Actinomycetes bacterium]|nr:glycosyl hydrolase [Actinomycetes bacterium]
MRKRVLLLGVLVLSLAVTAAGLATPAGAGPNDPTVLFGARPEPGTQQGTTTLEGKIGRRLAAIRVYYNWDSPFPDTDVTWFKNNGYALLLSVKSERRNHTFVQWRDIANAQPGSALHNDIVTWANRIKSLGTHVYFTFNHEPETSLNSSGQGADFIAAWRKVVTVFRGQGVTNADYLWIMTAFSFKARDRRRAVDWYPGEAYIDYMGADAYNWYNCRPGTSNPWNSLEQLLNPMRLFAQGRTIKGLMVPEWASTEDSAQPGRKAQWFADARALFKKPGWEGFKAVLYYNKSSKYPNCRWFVDSSQASLTAFSAMANDVYYSLDER